jgi:hypothetical protein
LCKHPFTIINQIRREIDWDWEQIMQQGKNAQNNSNYSAKNFNSGKLERLKSLK